MGVELLADADAFRDRAGAFLLRREAAHNLLLSFRVEDELDGLRVLAVITRERIVVAAAGKSGPYPLVLSQAGRPEVFDPLVDELRGIGITLPGVNGPPEASLRFAERWRAGTRLERRPWMTRIYCAEKVSPPTGVAGYVRPVLPSDHALLIDWMSGFHADTLAAHHRTPEEEADGLLAQPNSVQLWTVSGEPVSIASYGAPTPNSVRIRAVYTPPERRGRGYASANVAALTRRLLAQGWAFTTLFTEMSNPTSNRLYQRIGYRPVCDMHLYDFG